jgi:ABC-type uncharacterized transport system permease subunit
VEPRNSWPEILGWLLIFSKEPNMDALRKTKGLVAFLSGGILSFSVFKSNVKMKVRLLNPMCNFVSFPAMQALGNFMTCTIIGSSSLKWFRKSIIR